MRRPSPARGAIPPATRKTVPRGVWKGGFPRGELELKLAASHKGGRGCTSSIPARLAFANAANASHALARASDCMPCVARLCSRSAPAALRLRRMTFRQPPGLHIPWRFSLAVRRLRAWQMGPVTPAFRPMCDSAGSGQVSATHRGIDRQASMATGRSSVHCRPKGGGVIHHRLSCGRLDQPIESGPVVHEASCICRRIVVCGAARDRGCGAALGALPGGREAAQKFESAACFIIHPSGKHVLISRVFPIYLSSAGSCPQLKIRTRPQN